MKSSIVFKTTQFFYLGFEFSKLLSFSIWDLLGKGLKSVFLFQHVVRVLPVDRTCLTQYKDKGRVLNKAQLLAQGCVRSVPGVPEHILTSL